METTFRLKPNAAFGSKTGSKEIEPARAAKLRARTGTGPNVPIIELNVIKGVMKKSSRLSVRRV